MDINVDEKRLKTDPATEEMVKLLRNHESELGLEEAQFYYEFPILKDTEDKVIIAKVMLLSPNHGIIAINTIPTVSLVEAESELIRADEELDKDSIYSTREFPYRFTINTPQLTSGA